MLLFTPHSRDKDHSARFHASPFYLDPSAWAQAGMLVWKELCLLCSRLGPGFHCSFLMVAALIGVAKKPLSLPPRLILCMPGSLLCYSLSDSL